METHESSEVSVYAPDSVRRFQPPESPQESDGHGTDYKAQEGIFEENFLLIFLVATFLVFAIFAAVICFSH
jgi:hypothetical protein